MGLKQPCDTFLTLAPDKPKFGSGWIALDYGTVMHAVLPHMYDGDVTRPFEVFKALWERYPYGESDPKRNTSLTQSRIVDFVRLHTKESRTYER